MDINDIIIIDYLQLLHMADPSMHAFSTGTQSHGISSQLSILGKQLDLNRLKLLLFPFNHSKHWSLAVVEIDSANIATYFLYSSFNCTIEGQKKLNFFFKLIKQFLQNYYSNLIVPESVIVVEVPKKSNLYDRGVFICAYARCLSQGIDVDLIQKDISEIRKVIKECLTQNKLAHFLDFQNPAIRTSSHEEVERSVRMDSSNSLTVSSQPHGNEEITKLFDSAAKILNRNLTYEQFRLEADSSFEAMMYGLIAMRELLSLYTFPVDSVNSIGLCSFEDLSIHFHCDTEYQLFARASVEPLNEKFVNKELLSKVREVAGQSWCDWDGCPCNNTMHNNFKGVVTRHLHDTHYGIVCCNCGNLLKNKTLLDSHVEYCGGKKIQKKVEIEVERADVKSASIIVEPIEEEEEDEKLGEHNLDEVQPNSFMEGFMQRIRSLYGSTPSLENEIIMAAASLILSEVTHVETTRIQNLSSWPRYFLQKDKPFIIYEMGLKSNVTLRQFKSAIESAQKEDDLYLCNYSSCMFCTGKSHRFSSKYESHVKAHIRKHFKLACPKCRIGFLSIIDLQIHYKDTCLDNHIQNWLEKKFQEPNLPRAKKRNY